MRNTALITILMVGFCGIFPPTGALAQEAAAKELVPKQQVRVFKLQHASPDAVTSAVGPFMTMRSSVPLGVVIVQGSEEDLARAERLIRELDVPSQNAESVNVEITAWLLGASNEAESEPTVEALAPVIAQLKAKFPYQGYRLLDTVVVRAGIGRSARVAEVKGILDHPSFAPGPPPQYVLRVHPDSLSGAGSSRQIHFDLVAFSAAVPVFMNPEGSNIQMSELKIESEIRMREGQTIVVGKAGNAGSNQGVLLVLQSQIVE